MGKMLAMIDWNIDILIDRDINNRKNRQKKNRDRQIEKMNQVDVIKKKNNNNISRVVNCYLEWDDHIEEKSYLEKMHNEILRLRLKRSEEFT
ncbi:MAG TPA: hypothetical protein VFY64_04725 [Nitrososphaeraceae archaeon]|nr:hypothetical protein [Nitrososphaeraceae archaeon]